MSLRNNGVVMYTEYRYKDIQNSGYNQI